MPPSLQIIGFRTQKVRDGEDYFNVIFDAINKAGVKIDDNDVFVIVSKIVSLSENRIVKLDDVKASSRATNLGRIGGIDPRITELVLQEADEVYGSADNFMIARIRGLLQGNAGIDRSNIPDRYGSVLLYPKDPDESARRFREEVLKRTGKRVGVIISDSNFMPLRKGSVALAIGIAGFDPLVGELDAKDVFGNKTSVGLTDAEPDKWWIDSKASDAPDALAAAAGIVMGETDEQVPVTLIKGARVKMTDREVATSEFLNPPDKCPIMRTIAKGT